MGRGALLDGRPRLAVAAGILGGLRQPVWAVFWPLVGRLSAGGFDPAGSTPEEFTARFNTDVVEFAKVTKAANVPLAD